MITRVVAACARRPYVVLAAAALTAAAGYASQRGAGARRDPGSVGSAAGAGGRMDGTSRARGRGAGDRGVDRRARGRARLDGGARLVDGGHGVRRRRVRVGGGVARGARRDRPPGRARSRPRLPPAVHIQVGPEASATGWVLQYALRSAGRKAGDADGRGQTSRAGRGAPPVARVPGQGAAAARWSGSRASPRWRRWAASAKRWSSRPPTPSCAPRALPSRTSRPRCARGSAACPRPTGARTISSTTRCSRKLTRVTVAPAMASGVADVDGSWPIVVGIVIAKRGADPTAVIARVKEVIERERKEHAPAGEAGRDLRPLGAGGAGRGDALRAVAEEVVVVALVVLMFLLHGAQRAGPDA